MLEALKAKLPHTWSEHQHLRWLDIVHNLAFGRLVKDGDPEYESDAIQVTDPHLAQVVNSAIDTGDGKALDKDLGWRKNSQKHKILLDIDFPVFAVESSTPGHYHLYLDKEIRWDAYKTLLEALVNADVIEKGYANASIRRGFTTLRVPWIRKGDTNDVDAPRKVERIVHPSYDW